MDIGRISDILGIIGFGGSIVSFFYSRSTKKKLNVVRDAVAFEMEKDAHIQDITTLTGLICADLEKAVPLSAIDMRSVSSHIDEFNGKISILLAYNIWTTTSKQILCSAQERNKLFLARLRDGISGNYSSESGPFSYRNASHQEFLKHCRDTADSVVALIKNPKAILSYK